MKRWTQQEAIELCVKLESIAPKFGCHVALTGGCLYRSGSRADCDVLFYRIRQAKEINLDGLWPALSEIGFVKEKGFGWCFKAQYDGKPVDCFFPEEQGGAYEAKPDIEHAEEPPQLSTLAGEMK